MSRKLRSDINWDSSSEEDDSYDSTYAMQSRESLRNTRQPVIENDPVVETRKRGRGPSKRPCLNRNALMARENRLRKKAYLQKVENKLSFYQQENKTLVSTIKKQGVDIKRLNNEVAYLRSVLNNNTAIAALLKTINDGLRKIGTQKTNMYGMSNIFQCSEDTNTQSRCACQANVKENMLNSQNINVFVNTNNEHLAECNAIQSQSNGACSNLRRHVNCKDHYPRKSLSFADTDHTYVSKNSTVCSKCSPDTKEVGNALISFASSMPEELDDSKALDGLIPTTQVNLSTTDERKDIDMINTNFDQLTSFNMDIFEDLPKCDDILNTVDSLHDASNLFMEEEMFKSLDNTGICLHVNSDKVSLEFCSICQLNGKTSGLN